MEEAQQDLLDADDPRLHHKPRPNIPDPLKAGGLLGDPDALRARIAEFTKVIEAEEQRRGVEHPAPELALRSCWALPADGSMVCAGGMHSHATLIAKSRSWPCRARRVRQEHKHLAKLLLECGVPLDHDGPVSPLLAASYQHDRPYRVECWDEAREVPLKEVIPMILGVARQLTVRNGYFHGPTGTGKSHLHALLFFIALESGLDAVWIDDTDMRRLVMLLRSLDPVVRSIAQLEWNALLKKSVIFYSDIGLETDPARDQISKPLLAAWMWSLLEGAVGTMWATGNLPPIPKEKAPMSLSEHPDVGARVVSRLIGARTDSAALSAAVRAAAQAERMITAEERAACMHSALILKFSEVDAAHITDQRMQPGLRAREAAKKARA